MKKKEKDANKKINYWKIILITLGSVLGGIGVIILALYLSGAFNPSTTEAEDLFFADIVITEEGEKYVNRGSKPYDISSNFDLLLSTTTQQATSSDIKLDFPKLQSKIYLIQVDLDEESPSASTQVFYAFNDKNELIKFFSCGESLADYITNGVVIVPNTVKLNSKFDVYLNVKPDDSEDDYENSKLYNVGGYAQLIATSLSNRLLGSTSTSINVDVPVESIEIIGITGDNLSPTIKPGTNEVLLNENDGKVEVGINGLFSAILNVTPQRSIYKFGKDGKNGEVEYKTVVFALDNDVNNFGNKISFVDINNQLLQDLNVYGKNFVFDGTSTMGASLLTGNLIGDIKIYARIFKNSNIENEAVNQGVSQIGDYYSAMGDSNLGITTEKVFNIKEIPIEGFSTTEKYNDGNPLKVDINYSNIIYANNPLSDRDLGIKILSSQGSVQNNIKNILFSIQYQINNEWYDATQTNFVNGSFIDSLFKLGNLNEIVTKNDLYIDETNKLYSYNFYRPVFLSASNLSYWEVVAMPAAEDLLSYGITSVRIYTYYLNPETGLVLDDSENFGPYYIETKVNSVVNPILEWNSDEQIKNSSELELGEYNERVYVTPSLDNNYNIINLVNLANINNINDNPKPTYTTIKYFVYSNNENLDNYLNVKKYNGTITNITSNIYEVESVNLELVVNNLTQDIIEFNLIFAVVENDNTGSPILYENGTYRIIDMPKNNDGIISAPIRIKRILEDFNVEIGIGNQVYPYGAKDENKETSNVKDDFSYFIQNGSGVFELVVTINEKDENLFENLLRSGEFYIENNEDLFVKINNIDLQLNDLLRTLFVDEGVFDKYADIVTKEIVEEKIVYKIKLSTKSLNFDSENAEKIETINVSYKINANNIPEEMKHQTKTTEDFYIYSGKIINAYFGVEGNKVESLQVEKSINENRFEVLFNGQSTHVVISEKNEKYYVNVYVAGFGINDGYSITSSNKSVVSVVWDETEQKYSINFLQSGDANLTLNLNYGHLQYNTNPSVMKVTITSNYTTDAIYNGVNSDDRLTSFDAESGYQMIGQSDNQLQFTKAGIYELNIDSKTEKSNYIVNVVEDTDGLLNIIYKETNKPTNIIEINPINETNYILIDGVINFTQAGHYQLSITTESWTENYFIIAKNVDGTIVATYYIKSDLPADIKNIVILAGEGEIESAIYFKNLISISATEKTSLLKSQELKVENLSLFNESVKYDVTYLYNFAMYYDNAVDFEEKIIKIYDQQNNIIGFILKDEFGNSANITISASCIEIGESFIFNVIINPSFKLEINTTSHPNAQKPQDSELNSYAVFSETDVVFSKFSLVSYDYLTGLYSIPYDKELYYTLIDENGNKYTNDQLTEIAELTFDGRNLSKIKFKTDNAKFILRISDSEDPKSLDLVYDVVFYVNDNIQLDIIESATFEKDNIEYEERSGEIVNLENVNVYRVNNISPVLNGSEIKIDGSKLIIGDINIPISRIYGSEVWGKAFLIDNGNYLEVNPVNNEMERVLKFSYGSVDFYIVYNASPNIKVSSENILTYNGEQYLGLYAGMSVSDAYSWFTYNNSPATVNLIINFGQISTGSNILSLPRLYSKVGASNIDINNNPNNILITEEGLIITKILVYIENGGQRESRAFNVLITPFRWDQFIRYDGTEKDADVKDVLHGAFVKEFLSGDSLTIGGTNDYCVYDIEKLLGSASSRITYKLYSFNNGIKEEVSELDTTVKIERVDGILTILSEPFAKDRKYIIEFTYTGKATGFNDAIFVFDYFINIKATQKIDIYYPQGSLAVSLEDNLPTDEELLANPSLTVSEIFDGVNEQIIYYDMFKNGSYSINLNKNLMNFNKQKPNSYVQVFVKDLSIVQNSETENYNKLYFEVYGVYIDNNKITENLENYVTISNTGEVVVKNQTQNMGIIIKVYTSNSAENYYKIWACARPNNVHVTYNGENFTVNNQIIMVEEVSLNNFTNELLGELNYEIVDEYGRIQTNSDMIYIEEGFIKAKSSPNEQSAYLIVYNEEYGIISKIKLIKESPIKIFTTPENIKIYSDTKNIDIRSYLSIDVNQQSVSYDNSNLLWNVLLNGNYDNFLKLEGTYISIYPVNEEKTVSLSIEVYSSDNTLPGTSEDNRCRITFDITVLPKVSAKENLESEISANNDFTINLEEVFVINSGSANDYLVNVYITWNGTEDESYKILFKPNIFKDEKFNYIKFSFSHVAKQRIANVSIQLHKEENGVQVGESIIANYKVIINPAYTVTINYEDYETGNNFNSEYVYINEKNLEINLADGNRIKVNKTETDSKDILTFVSTSEDYVVVDQNGKLNLKDKAKSILIDTPVTIEIYLKDTKILLGLYEIVLSTVPVLRVEFVDSQTTNKNEYTSVIPDTNIELNVNPFAIQNGTLKIETKAGTQNEKFSFILSAIQKNNGASVSSLKPVKFYGIGTTQAGPCLLFIINNENLGIKSQINYWGAMNTTDQFDILGISDDSEVAVVENNRLKFLVSGEYAIKIISQQEEKYYFVVVNGSDTTYYSPLEKSEYKFSEIFGEIENEDLYEFTIDSANVVNAGVVKEFKINQPNSIANFYYKNGATLYKIPQSLALEMFTYSISINNSEQTNSINNSEQKNLVYFKYTDYDYNIQKTLRIYNSYGTESGVYVYTIVYDYKFNDKSFDTITKENDKFVSESNLSDYITDNTGNIIEFDDYTDDYTENNLLILISKTIELDAGQSYSLIEDILKRELGLTTFEGGTFTGDNFKGKLAIDFGKYISNSAFEFNKSDMISFTQTNKDYILTPHGAKNDGDFVHLSLTIGNLEYILRIKIIPDVVIRSLSQTGETVVSYKSTLENGIMQYAISNLIYTQNINPSDLIVTAVLDSDYNYLIGNQNNYLKQINLTSYDISAYGLEFNKTVLGGAVIKLRIYDIYGYQVTDSTGTPIVLTIRYQNESGQSIAIDEYESASSIYEGETFVIYAKIEKDNQTAYYKYNGDGWVSTGENISSEDAEAADKKLIILENVPYTVNESNNIVLQSLTINLASRVSGALNAPTDYTVNILPTQTYKTYGGQRRIDGDNFTLSISVNNENEIINESITLKYSSSIIERYYLKVKDLYSGYDKLYLPNNTTVDWSNYICLYDAKLNKEEELSNSESQIEANGKFVNKISNNNYTVDIKNSKYDRKLKEATFSYAITTKYYNIDFSEANVVGTYGIVLKGTKEKEENVPLSTWLAGVKFKDFYGNIIEVADIDDLGSYISEINGNVNVTEGTISELKAGESVKVNIYGESSQKDEGTLLSSINVTRSLYYSLSTIDDGDTGISASNNIIPFMDNNGNGWGNVVKPLITGGTETGNLVGELAGFFNYNISSDNAKILYDEILNQYVVQINEKGTIKVIVEVKYMGNILGLFTLSKADDNSNWIAETEIINNIVFTGLNSEGEIAGLGEKIVSYMIGDGSSNSGNGLNKKNLSSEILIPSYYDSKPVTLIGYWAFKDCENLIKITIPDSVTSIGDNAFSDCTKLESITLGDNVQNIGYGAFANCTSLKQIEIPEGVTNIDGYTFSGCTSLEAITIPDSVTSIGANAFNGCTNLNYNKDGNGNYLGNKDNPHYALIKATSLNITDIEINSNCKIIAGSAFNDCTSLTAITIPKNVISIGDKAFNNCTGLQTVTIGDGVTSLNGFDFTGNKNLTTVKLGNGIKQIRNSEFSGCTKLASVTIGNGVESIGASAFNGCTSLTAITIPNNVISIGDNAFNNCTGLQTVTIGNGVTSLNGFNFTDNKNLTTVKLGNGIKQIRDSEFSGCTNLKNVTIGNGVESIGASAFNGCSSLTKIIIPDSVTSIGSSAFNGCTNLTATTIPDNVTSIGDNAFNNCTGLQTVTIGNGVTSLNGFNFTGNENLTTVNLGNGIKQIRDSEFSGCTELASVTIGNGVESIGSSAFNGCTNLTAITIPDNVTSIGDNAFNNCTGLQEVTIGDGVTSLNGFDFTGNKNLTTVTLGNGIKQIRDSEFSGCTNLESVTIGSGVESIGDNAFNRCSSLTEVIIPDSVISIGVGAFDGCTKLAGVTIENGVESIGASAFEGCMSLTEIVIPDSVISIGAYAFNGCSSLTEVIIPDSVTSIGSWTFNGCTSLTAIIIPDSVTSIGIRMFNGCTKLASVTIGNGVESIGGSAFDGCTSLTAIIIPDSVTSIGDNAFSGCTQLANVTIGNGVESIGNNAFYGCTKLNYNKDGNGNYLGNKDNPYYALIKATSLDIADIEINSNCKIIAGSALNGCSSLTEVIIPDSVISIGVRAFSGCTKLANVTIGSGVESIGASAFQICINLTNITLNSNLAEKVTLPTVIGKKWYLNDKVVTTMLNSGVYTLK